MKSGFYTHHDDVQVIRLHQMHECIVDGQIPCRWVPDLGGLYGYPLFNYYAPLPYYVGEIFYLIIGDLIISAKLMFAVSLLGSYVFMYLFAKEYWGKLGGVLSALFFVYAPYHAVNLYVRGAMGEMWAMMWFPAILWSFTRLSKKLNLKNTALSGLLLALLITSHNLSALIFMPVLIAFIIIIWLGDKNHTFLRYSIIGLILGFLISSFYWIPALAEKSLVHVNTTTVGYFSYTEHFKGLRKIFLEADWNWGPSIREIPGGEPDAKWYKFGSVHSLFWLISLPITYLFYRKRKTKEALVLVLFNTLLLVSIFMIHPRSLFVWKVLDPLIKYLQFPWRFLMFTAFFASFIAGSAGYFFKRKESLSYLIAGILIFSTFSYFRPEKFVEITQEEYLSGDVWVAQINRSIFDYLPVYAKAPPAELASKRYEVVDGISKVENYSESSDFISFNTNSAEESIIRVSQYYFPGWMAYIDGESTSIIYNNDLGLMDIVVPRGLRKVELIFTNSPIRNASNVLSVLGILILIFLFLKKEKRHAN